MKFNFISFMYHYRNELLKVTEFCANWLFKCAIFNCTRMCSNLYLVIILSRGHLWFSHAQLCGE